MRRRNDIIMEYGTYVLLFFASYIASLAGLYLLSALALMLEALYLYVHLVREAKNLTELRALFTVAWVGGQSLACLQLSRLQRDWNYVTWLCFFVIYVGFGIGYEWGRTYSMDEVKKVSKNCVQAHRLFLCIIGLAAASVACVLLEGTIRDSIPLFSYKIRVETYLLSGIHYFAVSCVLIPAITILYLKTGERTGMRKRVILALSNLVAVLVPFLYVSRVQLLFAAGFAVVTYIMVNRTMRLRTMAVIILALVPVYVAVTLFRHHNVAYLNSVFEMKDTKIPIFITQPYMYVANNFENFNCMVEQLPKHTWGARMLLPLFALTGLKFTFPRLAASVVYLTKPELTTRTIFYDAYYDFGVVGVFLFAALLGAAAKWSMRLVKKSDNPVAYLFYAQLAVYLGLAFFATWFSDPIIWFWLILTGMMYWFTGYDRNKGRNGQGECAEETA